jgi:hypothetical protein
VSKVVATQQLIEFPLLFLQDGSSNRVMQQVQRLQEEELNNCLNFFQHCN